MKGEWKVTSNYIDGKKVFGVYRNIDVSEIDHSGNREMAGEYTLNQETAQIVADALNEQEEAKK